MVSSLLNESHNWNSSNSYKDQSMDFDDYDLNDQNFNESSTVTYKLSPMIVAISITQIIFTIFGIFLKFLIIYYEQFGRDTQKRPLLNRVSTK